MLHSCNILNIKFLYIDYVACSNFHKTLQGSIRSIVKRKNIKKEKVYRKIIIRETASLLHDTFSICCISVN